MHREANPAEPHLWCTDGVCKLSRSPSCSSSPPSLSLPLSSFMSHILPSSHHAVCHSADSLTLPEANHLGSQPSRLNLINEALQNWQAGWEHHGWVNVSWKLGFIKTVILGFGVIKANSQAAMGLYTSKTHFMPDDPLLPKELTEHWGEPVRVLWV